MRPVRFVALSEDGHALVLTDEFGRLLGLPVDERLNGVLRPDGTSTRGQIPLSMELSTPLSPRDIQSRIRSGSSAEEVARAAGVPVDRVLRYAGPVLQERAMMAQHARRTRLRNADRGGTLADVVDTRLARHGVDADKVSWDAYRREDGTWRILAVWPSGKATAQATWELDKARQAVAPFDDMAQYLCTERPAPVGGHDVGNEPARGGHDAIVTSHDAARDLHTRDTEPIGVARTARPGRALPDADPIRASRDALLASLDRPLGKPEPAHPGRLLPSRQMDPAVAQFASEDLDAPREVPTVPSLAVLRPRRTGPANPADQAATAGSDEPAPKGRKRLPSWDDVLFGGGPAAG